jgi:DNA-binding NtrC family response regulator
MLDSTAFLASTDESVIETVGGVFKSFDKLELCVCGRIEEVCSRVQRHEPALVLAHVHPHNDSGGVAQLLQTIATRERSTATVVLSDQYEADHARALLRRGAADYLSRPFDLSRLNYLVDRLTVRARYPAGRPRPAGLQCLGDGREPFYYNATPAPFLELLERIRRVIPLDTTLLLGGETGTGKTRLARLIHELSPRSQEPFMVVNCGALSATLIESEMFGHVKGSFTGADRDRTGKFADVGRGTLFLDEVDSLPVELQAKLLRVVDERVFEPVGCNKSQPLQARLIAACNRPLDQEVAAGRFRSDLYYRLNVVGFYLPPLRERRYLIQPLAARFVEEFAAQMGRSVRGVGGAAMRALSEYDWPGNIRELRNVVQRAVALCAGDEIEPEDLPDSMRPGNAAPRPAPTKSATPPPPGEGLAAAKQEAEIARIADALRRNGNNRLRAAAELGISRMTLYKKLHKYGLMSAEMDRV